MLAAHVYHVQAGDTLSAIAQSKGLSLSQIESDNPQISNPDLITVGETVFLVPGLSGHASAPRSAPTPVPVTPAQVPTQPLQTSSGGGLTDIPGVPSSFVACVAFRESTDLQNPAANGNAYGIIPASGHNVEGASLAQQKQAFSELYQADGGTPWAADGCPGT